MNSEVFGLEVRLHDGSQPFDEICNGNVGWYSPREYLRSLPGVVKADYINTSSSAGDWDGWFAVESGDGVYQLVNFSQENSFPDSGYTLYTGSIPFAEVDSLDREVIDDAISDYLSYYQDASCSDVWDDIPVDDDDDLVGVDASFGDDWFFN